jgi:glycosyltransferase involved in cell wall biosynthesis
MRNQPENDRDTHNSPLSVVVCIITYRRLHGLQRLLESLQYLTFIEVETPTWQVVVVDNDREAPAQRLVEEIRETFPVPIIYGVEPVQGIASARNKAIELAPTCDFVAFIDDDEAADPLWLDQLLHVQRLYQADIVTGPVLPDFEKAPPEWVLRGRMFDRPRLPTGTQRHFAATHNTLVKYAWTQKLDGPFDLRFNLTGGSDSHFSRRVIQKGGQVIWADEAIVREYNPPKRMTATWLLQRSFRIAYNTALHEKELYSFFVVMLRFIKAIYHLLLGVLLIIPLFIYFGYAGIIKGLQRSARGLGALYGLFGGHYEEYAKKRLNAVM